MEQFWGCRPIPNIAKMKKPCKSQVEKKYLGFSKIFFRFLSGGQVWSILGVSADFPYCQRFVLAGPKREPTKQSLWETGCLWVSPSMAENWVSLNFPKRGSWQTIDPRAIDVCGSSLKLACGDDVQGSTAREPMACECHGWFV